MPRPTACGGFSPQQCRTAGTPRDIKVVKSLGKGLDEKTIDAIKTWKFEPAAKNGVPVKTQIAPKGKRRPLN